MAKRSPILGYNHNVRYRGIVFHVQTEDSGVLSPHLFTHLFHHGVIVSTRKLVYDSGSAEDSIKALMQAQHKAVLKDLKRGSFDDKIDQYLGGTPGLLPAGTVEEPQDLERGSQPVSERPSAVMQAVEVEVESEPESPNQEPAYQEIVDAPVGERTDAEIAISREPTIAMAREVTLEDPAIGLRPTEPAVDARTIARAMTPPTGTPLARTPLVTRAATAPVGPRAPTATPPTGTPVMARVQTPPAMARTQTPPAVARVSSGDLGLDAETIMEPASDLLLELELDDGDEPAGGRRRAARDTDVIPLEDPTRPTLDIAPSDGVPGALPPRPSLRPNESSPTGSVTQPMGGRAQTQSGPVQRPSTAVGASALPPARPINRPPSRPSIVPPQVVTRPVPAEDRRAPPSDAVEVYAAATPSAELPSASMSLELPPPTNAPERPGQYSQHKKINARIPDGTRDGLRLQAQNAAAPPLPNPPSVPPARASSVMPAVAPPRVSPSPPVSPVTKPGVAIPTPATRQSGVIVPPPARSGSAVMQAVAPPSSGPATSRPPPTPARPAPLQAGAGASGASVRPTPVPMPAGRAQTSSPAPAAHADTERARVPKTGTPAAGVPIAMATAPTAPVPASSPVPVVQAGSGAATVPTGTMPAGSRTASGAASSGGVVVTRPAVIVGAPGKPAPATQRIRKAREDEGRGFGQGLISEKSLDEVILAYLSEDADDK